MNTQINLYNQFYQAGIEYARVWKDENSNSETQTDEALYNAAMQEIGINDIADDEVELMVAAFRTGFDSFVPQSVE